MIHVCLEIASSNTWHVEMSASKERLKIRISEHNKTTYSPAAHNVNLLVETVILNYMVLHGEQSKFSSTFTHNDLGGSVMMDKLTAFQQICDGVTGKPV